MEHAHFDLTKKNTLKRDDSNQRGCTNAQTRFDDENI